MQSSHKHQTAILVFAYSSSEEMKHKAIPKGNELFDVLTQQTLNTVKESDIPYFHFSEKQQVGYSFGERFTNAIQTIFNQGYESIITIGNDAPQLKISHLREAEKQLKSKKFVLGPTRDGGFYLMGLNKNHFDVSTFKTLAWQSSALNKQLLQLVAKASEKPAILQTLIDIDAIADIKLIIAFASHIPKKLLLAFRSVVGFKKSIQFYTCFLNQILSLQTHHNKGSPLLLLS